MKSKQYELPELDRSSLEGCEIVSLRYVLVDDLVLLEGNPKLHNIGLIAQSISDNGFLDPPKWDANLNRGQGGIVEGNGRAETLKWMQDQKQPIPRGIAVNNKRQWAAPVLFGCDANSEAAAKKYSIEHNSIVMSGSNFTVLDISRLYEPEGYLEILLELNQQNELPLTVDGDDLDLLLQQLNGEGSIGGEPQEENEEEVADLIDNVDSIDSRVKRGEVWAIGDSALIMCGDCRDTSDIHFLIRDEPINLVVTSPPYASQRKYDESSGFKPIHPSEYIDWFEPVQSNIKRHLAKDGSFFLNIKEHCEDGQRHLYVKKLTIAMVEAFGWKFVDELCWKRKAPPGKWDNRLRNDWEPVFHFSCGNPKVRHKSIAYQSDAIPVKGGGRNDHLGDHWNLSSQLESGLAIPGNVVECAGVEQGTGHTAAYPIGLPEFFVKAFSDESDRVFDPFMGSGTTAVAAVKNNRKALGTEISEQYCEIILRRLEKLTGKDAERFDVL